MTKYSFAEGPEDAKIMLIGEAPGKDEDACGRPFVGVSGRALTNFLASAGLQRSRIYLTNVVKERPKDNVIKPFIDFKRNSVETSVEYNTYEKVLHREIEELNPHVIVPLGRVALYATTRHTEISKYRGSILESIQACGSRKVVPTYHPSSAMRQYIHSYFIIRDLQRVYEEQETPDINLPERNIKIRPTFEEAIQYLRSCHLEDKIAFDIEVWNLQVSCISFAKNANDVMSIAFHSLKGDTYSIEEEGQLWVEIQKLLEAEHVTKIAQNACFDVEFLFNRYGILTKPVEDTMIMHHLLYPDFPKGLDFLTSVYTREPYYKDDGKLVFKGLVDDDEALWIYNAKDSAVTYEVYDELLPRLQDWNMPAYHRKIKMIYPIVYMMQQGFRTGDLQGQMDKLKEEADKTLNELHEMVGREINPRSSSQLITYFYKEKKYTQYTKQGRPTCDDTALKRLAIKGAQEAVLIRRFRKLMKLRDFFNMKLAPDKRLYCSYNPVGTVTGRLSSGKRLDGVGGNQQNHPKAFRKELLADEGYIAVSADLSQAENRIVAFTGPVPEMREAFLTGVDIHSLTYARMFAVPIEEVSSIPGSSRIGDGSRSQRDWGKMLNHALNYGLGPRSLGLRCEIHERDARTLHTLYHTVYPGVRSAYQKKIEQQLFSERCVTNPYGKNRKFMDRITSTTKEDAYAHYAQSTVADKMDEVLDFMMCCQELKEVKLVNQIHDSVEFLIPEDWTVSKTLEALSLIEAEMSRPIPYKEPFSIPVEFKIGYNFGEWTDIESLTPEGLDAALEELINVRTSA